jgi:hypothetical protein
MDSNKVKGAAGGLLLLGLAFAGAIAVVTVAAPGAAAHENCYSTTPDGCGTCDGKEAHSHYMTGPAPLPWCHWKPKKLDEAICALFIECPTDRDGFRLSGA